MRARHQGLQRLHLLRSRPRNNECRENQAERVLDKERSNFCDYFKPAKGGGADPNASRDAMKAAADALFGGGKKKAGPSEDDPAS